MPLYCKQQGAGAQQTLVFLHGFLGDHSDWQACTQILSKDFHCICFDLPGHGNASYAPTPIDNGFDTCHRLISQTLKRLQVTDYILVGYSLGGRIALDYARTEQDTNLKGLVLESAHIGLSSETEKTQRYLHDKAWAKRFAQEPIRKNLKAWYLQPVFAELNAQQISELIDKRAHNLGNSLASMLLSTSLAKQHCAKAFLTQSHLPIHYLFGEQDKKFAAIAKTLPNKENIQIHGFNGIGHNIHLHSPVDFAKKLIHILSDKR